MVSVEHHRAGRLGVLDGVVTPGPGGTVTGGPGGDTGNAGPGGTAGTRQPKTYRTLDGGSRGGYALMGVELGRWPIVGLSGTGGGYPRKGIAEDGG